MRRATGLLALVVALAWAGPAVAEHTLKIATLAPEGSTWWKTLIDGDQQVRAATQGRVRLRIYAGGVAGDEPDVVRKMRIGQLHGGAITSVGLADIQPALLVLQAPGLFAGWEELDAVRTQLSDKLKGLLAEKGFVVLTWGDVGFSQLFSNVPVTTPADLKRTKPWSWTQDGVYQAFYRAAGVKTELLGVPQVLQGLQTGLIDAFSTPPLAALSLQWFGRAKHVLDVPISATIGAIVLTEKSLAPLDPADRETLMRVGQEIGAAVASQVRTENLQALEAIRKSGVTLHTADAAARAAWVELARQASDSAAGTVYPRELLEEIRSAVAKLRAARAP